MKKIKVIQTIFAAMLFTMFSTAQAAMISIMPAATEVEEGDSFSLDIMFMGGDGENLADYDFSVMFDDSIISLQSWSFGTETGFGDGFEGLDLMSDNFVVYDLSLWSVEDIQAEQADSFVLITLTFDALMEGMTELMVDAENALVGDEFGVQLQTIMFESAMVTVTAGDPSNVPAPATFLLASLLLPAVMRRRK